MEKRIDLHTHSIYSDGSMTPAELVRHAKDEGLSAIALSDHDSIGGVAEAVEEGKRVGIEVIPAIELSAEAETETHILGYYIDINNPALLEKLEYVRQVRREREEEICEKLRGLGFDVSMEEVEELAETDVLCRAHFAKLMVAKGYVESVKQAFDLYLANGRPAYSGRQAMTDEEAVRLIAEAGGVSFLAHLHLTRKPHGELVEFVKRLRDAGLCGIEGYYTEYTPEMQDEFQAIARDLGMPISGGTDFHGAFKPHISIGRGLGNMSIPYSLLDNIKNANN